MSKELQIQLNIATEVGKCIFMKKILDRWKQNVGVEMPVALGVLLNAHKQKCDQACNKLQDIH